MCMRAGRDIRQSANANKQTTKGIVAMSERQSAAQAESKRKGEAMPVGSVSMLELAQPR